MVQKSMIVKNYIMKPLTAKKKLEEINQVNRVTNQF
jgi:hypothetical protein